jgi:Ca2+-binding RTX toxin-like protein
MNAVPTRQGRYDPGGKGDDTYIVHNVNDLTIEDADAGHDTISTARSWILDANFEDMLLTGDAAINGTGNELANKITGNAKNNILDGKAGDDTMIGGLGDDADVDDSAKGVITDSSGANDESSSPARTCRW